MKKRIFSLVVIFLFTTIAWVFLGNVTGGRTYEYERKMREGVGRLWGGSQVQEAPQVYMYTETPKEYTETKNNVTVTKTKIERVRWDEMPEATDAEAVIELEPRKKGLSWYSTYSVRFKGRYTIRNTAGKDAYYYLDFNLPSPDGIYDEFSVRVDGSASEDGLKEGGRSVKKVFIRKDGRANVEFSYSTRGMDKWEYSFGEGMRKITNVKFLIRTNFEKIDFPEMGFSPVTKVKNGRGWDLIWEHKNLLSGIRIGVTTPQKINPGPFVTRLTFFAPVSLFFFFFLLYIITTVKRIKLHPMNYFFIATGFFSFHLLMSYLADQTDIVPAFIICSLVSLTMVISYMRLVVNLKFSLVEIGMSQLVYLVLFSAAFFLEGFTGLSITVLAIVTQFIVMQLTGRVNWSKYDDEESVPEKGK